MLDIQFLVRDNLVMNNRKRFQRICHFCGRSELVRSDQLNRKCKPCQTKISGNVLKDYNAKNPEVAGLANRKHGMHNTRLYRIHKGMMERCGHMGNRHKWAMYYEDREIRVCQDWHNRETFFAWALSNGYSDELELDRIDNEKGYQPDNCRWVTHLVNMRNRRNSTTAPSLSSGATSLSSPIF